MTFLRTLPLRKETTANASWDQTLIHVRTISVLPLGARSQLLTCPCPPMILLTRFTVMPSLIWLYSARLIVERYSLLATIVANTLLPAGLAPVSWSNGLV